MRALARSFWLLLLAASLAGGVASIRLLVGDLVPMVSTDDVETAPAGALRERLARAQEAASVDPWRPEAGAPLAAAVAMADGIEAGRGELDRSDRYRPTVAGLFLRGALALEAGRSAEAAELFAKVRRLSPADRPAWRNGLLVESRSGSPASAAALAAEMELRWPGAFDPLVALGNEAASVERDPALALRRNLLARASLASRPPGGAQQETIFPPAAVDAQIARLVEVLGGRVAWMETPGGAR